MSLTLGFMAVIPAIFMLVFVIIMKKEMKTKIAVIKGKKKGIMKIEFYDRANHHQTKLETPKDGKIEINGLKYLIEKGTIYYDTDDAVQCLLIREGDMKTQNIFEQKDSRIDPQELDLALKHSYALGKLELLDFGDMKTIKKIVLITAGVSALSALLSFIAIG